MIKACSVARGVQAVPNRSVGDDSMPSRASVFAVLAPAVKLFSNFLGEAMGRLLILGLQACGGGSSDYNSHRNASLGYPGRGIGGISYAYISAACIGII